MDLRFDPVQELGGLFRDDIDIFADFHTGCLKTGHQRNGAAAADRNDAVGTVIGLHQPLAEIADFFERRFDGDGIQRKFAKAEIPDRSHEPLAGVIVERKPRWRHDDGDPFAPALRQPLDRLIGIGLIVEIMKGMVDSHIGAPMGDEGHVALGHETNARIVGLNLRNNDPIRRTGIENIADRHHRILGMDVGRYDQMILCCRKNLSDAEDHLAGETHQFFIDAQHKGNHIGLAGAKAHPGAVWLVTDLPGDQPHAFLGFSADIGRILQCARDGGDAETRHIGDCLQGRTFARGRGYVVPAGFASIVHVISPRFTER